MVRYLPMLLVLGLMLYCFFDVLATDRRWFRTLGKVGWLMVVLLPVIGALLWLFVGRPRHRARRTQEPVIQLRRREREVAPDDDPAFLRTLDERAWRAKREAAHRKGDPVERVADDATAEDLPPTSEPAVEAGTDATDPESLPPGGPAVGQAPTDDSPDDPPPAPRQGRAE